jgi:DNA-binding response OmpR family regulator
MSRPRCRRARRWITRRDLVRPLTTHAAPDAAEAHMLADNQLILVVEDDPNIADLVELYLRRDGFLVQQAADGDTALRRIRERHPQLVVLDLGLPGAIDGLEVCRQVRATSDLPIIMLTARDDEIDRVLGFELGADDYVTKPFSPRELV